jgi:hypothetical protein
MPYKCTWWEMTEKYTPFDKNGISSPIFRPLGGSLDAGEVSQRDLPAGALYARPAHEGRGGADGLKVYCVLPDKSRHHWLIDGRASNCTMPKDQEHRCWVRHGSIGDKLHVDKKGNTCQAGAGSIKVPGYHGFLHNGELTDG